MIGNRMSQTRRTSTERIAKENEAHHQTQSGQQQPVWYCPSRWLLAHYDLAAGINTMSSHMCLADLNNDGEGLLALIDFKRNQTQDNETTNVQSTPLNKSTPQTAATGPPYECRMRVYRGQQLICNHFLDDMPACLIVSSLKVQDLPERDRSLSPSCDPKLEQAYLTMPINDDVYFYHKLRASHKLSLDDEEVISNSLNKSEVGAWQMALWNETDPEVVRDLLVSLSQEHGNHELTSHTHNFIALGSSKQRREYLTSWKLAKLARDSFGARIYDSDQLMSMDTICCAAARLGIMSNISRSGDYAQWRNKPDLLNSSLFSKVARFQGKFERNGLVLGTEDRHLLIYELRGKRNSLTGYHRLPATPDHILVERRSPQSIANEMDSGISRESTYKILVSCRDCRIYSLEQPYESHSKVGDGEPPRQLIALKSNALEMSWTGLNEPVGRQRLAVDTKTNTNSGASSSSGSKKNGAQTSPCFVVACLDRRLYCFGSQSGHCKWIIELELPVTCVTCLPELEIGREATSLIGVGSQANRVDFYAASTGRIADSIYFNQNEYPQAMTFGRYGREDNCLCLVTNSGSLLVLILKRTAKFAHGQCLSSAASYAASSLAACRQVLKGSEPIDDEQMPFQGANGKDSTGETQQQTVKLDQRVNLPSGFELSKSNSNRNATDQMIDSIIQSNHNCDQTSLKGALDLHSQGPRLQVPVKGRDFVDQILEQSRESVQTSRVFTSHMVRLRYKIKTSLEQRAASLSGSSASMANGHDEGNRLVLTQVLGLGNGYRIKLALRVNLEKFIDRYHELLSLDSRTDQWALNCFLRPGSCGLSKRQCQIRPFRQTIAPGRDEKAKYLVRPACEANLEAKLTVLGPLMEPTEGDFVPVEVQIYIHHQNSASMTSIQRPILLTSIDVNLMTS